MEPRELLEQALYKLSDVKEAIDERIWHSEDREWYADLTELIRSIAAKLDS